MPNGLGAGGLQVAPGVAGDPSLWQGAKLPVQFNDGDRVKVGIEQTQAKAILTWDTFNVGAKTDLTFDQKGNRDWVALNRVLGSDGRPSQILGSIKADGSVYVINQNGIVFGGASQVNVGALVASSAKISNEQFLSRGLYSAQTGSAWQASFTQAGGKVSVEAGAVIETHAPASVTAGGGFVLLLGGEVENTGQIATPLGQALLAAGDDFVLRRGYGTDANSFSTTRGSEIAPVFAAGSGSGLVRNSGLIFSQRGDITLAGRSIVQDGALLATTSVNTRGTIHLLNSASDTQGSVRLGAGSLTMVAPELDSIETALNSQRDALIAQSAVQNLARAGTGLGLFDNLSRLADRLDQSRIEIVSGGNVVFAGGTGGAGSLTIAQGGQVAVSAGRRVFSESGAVIDVSGVRDVALPMSANNLKVNIQGNELRDSPQNRDNDYLRNADVWLDLRDLIYVPSGTGGYDGERYYTPGGLLEVGGYLANTAHRIGEWSALGGTITLAAPEVVAQKGAVFDISGGSVRFEAGYIYTTNFLSRDGRLYNINQAGADMTFYGLGRGFIRESERWGVTEIWTDPLGRGRISRRWEEGYTVGRDAGSLNLSTPTAVFEGEILADIVQGERQSGARPDEVSDGYKLGQTTIAMPGTLALGRYTALGLLDAWQSAVRIGAIDGVATELDADAALPAERLSTVWLDAGRLSRQRLGGLGIATRGKVSIDGDLTLADGGSLAITAPIIDIKADITARGGSVTAGNILTPPTSSGTFPSALTLDGKASLRLAESAVLDVRGIWSNAGSGPAGSGDLAFVDGGDVRLESTGDVIVTKGSIIDASSGAAILADGSRQGGRGGNVSLVADSTRVTPLGGRLTLDGEIRAYGVSGGGTLKLESGPAIVIGGKVLETDGVLGVGERAPTNLTALEAFLVRAGEVLPADYNYTKTVALPGELLGGAPNFSPGMPVVLAQDWTPPLARNGNYYLIVDGVERQIMTWGTPPTFRAGATITMIYSPNYFPADYVVPANVFPNGMPIQPVASVLVAGDIAPRDVTFAAGTQIAAGTMLSQSVAIKPLLNLSASLFQSGFSDYQVNGHQGLAVAPGAALDIAMPVYRFTAAGSRAPSGADPASALELWTPPLYLENPSTATLTQRKGASLTLASGNSQLARGEGHVGIGEGASVTVDPGQAIVLQSPGQITVEGRLVAPGGRIDVLQQNNVQDRAPAEARPGARSIWVGEHAVLDVAARAVTARDLAGRTYGIAPDGGRITLGAYSDQAIATGSVRSAESFIVIRPGAMLDASGAGATLDLSAGTASGGLSSQVPGGPVVIAGDGGSIAISSFNGLYLDGTMKAAAGGAGAAGGTLALTLEAPLYLTSDNVPSDVRAIRELVVSQQAGQSLLPANLRPGEVNKALAFGSARIGVDQIEAGGVGNIGLLARELITFDGNVSLRAGQSIGLYQGFIANTTQGANASIAAPYVVLSGRTDVGYDARVFPSLGANWTASTLPMAGSLRVDADFVDVAGMVRFGTKGTPLSGGTEINRRGYDNIVLASRGDIRFRKWAVNGTTLLTAGDLTLVGAQVYPATDAVATVTAGALRTLTIGRTGDATPLVPLSVSGQLVLAAGTINQGGVLRAPLGSITFQGANSEVKAVNLLAGSLTSVSGAGLAVPYGGTVDGLVWRYDGVTPEVDGLGGVTNSGAVSRGISFQGRSLVVEAGAVLDLSGGGELVGAGFVSGRGGSVDVRSTALANANPGNGTSAPGNRVYAIVPTRRSGYAPVATAESDGDPVVGQQITLGAGVPGLAAGTYTLLPSDYALLPGAFRVEIGATERRFSGVSTLPDGSSLAAARLGIAGTGILDALPTQVTLTPADVVRTYSQYNATSYDSYLIAEAARLGGLRPMLPADAGTLKLGFTSAAEGVPSLRFDGKALFAPAEGGLGGTAAIGMSSQTTELEITGGIRTAGFAGVSLAAADLNALGARRLWIGGTPYINPLFPTNVDFQSSTGTLIVRDGAVIRAPEVVLVSGWKEYFTPTGLKQTRLVVEPGAEINTIGQGAPVYDSTAGIVYTPTTQSVIAVSNGWLNILPKAGGNGGGRIEIGLGGTRPAKLYSEGSVGFATSNTIALGDSTRYGGKYLSFAMQSINIGEDAALAAATTAGILPTGLTLNQATLSRLLSGDRDIGVPGIESLILTAMNSVNFYGAVSLDATTAGGVTGLDSLVINTPAIYGLGDSDDVASLKVGKLFWSGILTGSASQAPGAVLPGGAGTGSGKLEIIADSLIFGHADYARPNSQVALNRLMLGFATVDMTGKERISANSNGTLSVYQSAGVAGAPGTGGKLNLVTPLLTGEPASVNRITAGGALTLTSPGAGSATRVDGGLGAEIALKAATVTIASDIVLPAGRLTLSADGDIRLAANAHLDLSGRLVQMIDQVRATPGGDVIIESTRGNVVQEAGSSIDLSAKENQAGTLSVTALDAAGGHVSLAGAIHGTATGVYDAGGTLVPWLAGDILVRARTIADFAGLNARLNQGGVFGARSFQIKQGNLVIGDEVKATSVIVSVDGGSLTVNGKVDASGERVGTIRLSARDGLTLAPSAVLDAHGTVLRVDSYGQPIDAANRPVVELTTTQGTLTLSPGATIDLRSADTTARGTLTLNAPRVGANDVAIAAAGPLDIRGARNIALNAFRSYTPGNGIIDQGYLDAIHLDSTAFIDGALLNGALRGRIAGLAAYSNAFHLRPGVEITSTDKLTVQGDLDLSRYRYNSLNPLTQKTSVYGSGEAATLAIRAGGDLDIKGSISDGFAPPPGTPDDKGWTSAIVTFPNGVVTSPFALPAGATVPKGATFASGTVLDFDAAFGRTLIAEAGKPTTAEFRLPAAYTVQAGEPLPIYNENWDGFVITSDYTVSGGSYFAGDSEYVDGDVIPAGTFIYFAFMYPGSAAPFDIVLPQNQLISPGAVFSRPVVVAGPQIRADVAMPAQVKLASSHTLTASLVATGTIVTPTRTYNSGETIPAGTVLGAGTLLGVGTILPFAVEADSVVWPKGVPLAFTSSSATTADTVLTANGVLPAGTTGVPSLSLRSGRMWAVAPMLAPGSQSWSLRLAAGADLGAADSRAVRAASSLAGAGNITLDDLHYVNAATTGVVATPALSVVRTGTGDLELLAGGSYRQNSLFGVYTAGTQSAAVLAADGSDPFNLARGALGGSVLGPKGGSYEHLVDGGTDSIYQAWYPELGGNVLLAAQGDVYGYVLGRTYGTNLASNGIGNWLWRQGGDIAGQDVAWWINFGTYALDRSDTIPSGAVQLVGFSGIGALGGGNVTVRAGGNAGVTQGLGSISNQVSQGLDIAIGGTGRITADGRMVLTGGGDLTLDVGGRLNGLDPKLNPSRSGQIVPDDLNGTLTNLRGALDVSASAIGRVEVFYNRDTERRLALDPRKGDLFTADSADAHGGLIVAPGDATVRFSARRDLVLAGASDPGRVELPNTTPYEATVNGVATSHAGGGVSGFTLWTGTTAIDLLTAGGNLTPTTQDFGARSIGNDARAGDQRFIYPSILRAVAAEGNIYYGPDEFSSAQYNLVLAPSPRGQLELLAGGSIYAGGYAIDISGADPTILATPSNPAFAGYTGPNAITVTNISRNGPMGQSLSPNALFAFGADTVTGNLHLGDRTPALIYAVEGDILGFYSGSIHTFESFAPRDPMTWRVAAKPLWIKAGRDIVSLGAQSNPTNLSGTTAGLIVHSNPDDVSVVSAGRDILYTNLQVGGPGALEVSAGRNIYQGDKGSITSLGPLATGDKRPGASIVMQAGLGAAGPDYAALAARYLDPANLAVTGTPLAEQPGKVARTYEAELAAWLNQQTGSTGGAAEEVRAAFAALPVERQALFLRQVYFAELKAGGREYNDPASPRFGSYLRGREMIATLFPERDASGAASARAGDIIMFGGAGVRSVGGGDIQMLAPGGQIVVGVEGQVPPASAGVITQGTGHIQMYSQGSILLGLSRIMTTFGGDVLAWSAEGDINAGRGAKTTIVYTPPRRVYDDYGLVTLSPNVPSSGAGIAALNPIPGLPSGDIDLIAPLGTIDAGEAGIRSGGNVNLAALQIVNAANIQAQGKVTGTPEVKAPNIGGLTEASSAAGAAAQQAALPTQATASAQPSIIIVEVLGFGGGEETGGPRNEEQERLRNAAGTARPANIANYDRASSVQILGARRLNREESQYLTLDERQELSGR